MTANSDDFWNELQKFDLVKLEFTAYNSKKIEFITNYSFKTNQNLIFNFNINRAMIIYEEILNNTSDEFKYTTLCENTLIFLITALEVYFSQTFRTISSIINIGQVDYYSLKKLLNVLRININFKKYSYDSLKDIKLFHMLPKRLEFQDKKKCKVAFSLFDIDVPSLNEKIWKNIFSKNNLGYLYLRHAIIHGSNILSPRKFINLETVENCFLEICELVYLLEEKIIDKFPILILKSIDLSDEKEREKVAKKIAENYEKYLKYKDDL